MNTATQNSFSIPNVLTIAGSDSGGGAGIQADIKTISANGVYASSVITAVTAQNTQGVKAIHDVPLDNIAEQIDAVLMDIKCNAIKIGMLSRPEVIHLVAEKIQQYDISSVILDPVMVATSGDQLLHSESVEVMKSVLMPLVQVVTPNLYEAAILTGLPVATTQNEMLKTAEKFIELGVSAVLLKGGHLLDEHSKDVLIEVIADEKNLIQWFISKRIQTKNTHGTGCTLSSAIAAFLAKGSSLPKSVEHAKAYIQASINTADKLNVGQGSGPVHHFHSFY